MDISGPVDAVIAALADAQHGRVSRRQLLAAGLSDRQIAYRIRRGLLIPVHSGVYAVGHAHDDRYSPYVAALLTRPDPTVLCSHSAAALREFRPPPADGTVHILVAGRVGGGRRAGICVHRTADPAALKPHYVAGLPLTGPARTLLDLAADLPPRPLERALDEALTLGLLSLSELRGEVARNPCRRGVANLRGLLDARTVTNHSGSVGQERMLALIRDAGLPEPEGDARIGGGFEVDFLWRDARVALEFDGRRWHSSKWARDRDKRKSAYCEDHGIELVRSDWEDLAGAPALRLVRRLAVLTARPPA